MTLDRDSKQKESKLVPFTGRQFSRLISSFSQRLLVQFETRIWVIAILNLLTAAGFSLSIPFLSLYLYQDRDVPKKTGQIESLRILSVASDRTFLMFTGLSFLVLLVAGQMMSTLYFHR